MDRVLGVFCVGCFIQICVGGSVPASVDANSKLSSSYIPAAMQIIAHDTELMKYVIKPSEGSSTTSTTTIRPTPTHKPGVYSPTKPPGAAAYFSKGNSEAHYVQLQQQPSGINYFDRYNAFLPSETAQSRQFQDETSVFDEADKYLGKRFGDILRLANAFDADTDSLEEENQVLEFSKNFEDPDSEYKYDLLRQKKVPPTKAYVTLLSLYDLLNKEAKRLTLSKYSGYTEQVLNDLVYFSLSTSGYQLKAVLEKIIENGEIKKPEVVTKIKTLIVDLETEDSYINKALADIPPLVFIH